METGRCCETNKNEEEVDHGDVRGHCRQEHRQEHSQCKGPEAARGLGVFKRKGP